MALDTKTSISLRGVFVGVVLVNIVFLKSEKCSLLKRKMVWIIFFIFWRGWCYPSMFIREREIIWRKSETLTFRSGAAPKCLYLSLPSEGNSWMEKVGVLYWYVLLMLEIVPVISCSGDPDAWQSITQTENLTTNVWIFSSLYSLLSPQKDVKTMPRTSSLNSSL